MNDWAFAAEEELDGSVYMPRHHSEGKERVLIVSSKPGQHDHKIIEVMFAAITAAKRTDLYNHSVFYSRSQSDHGSQDSCAQRCGREAYHPA